MPLLGLGRAWYERVWLDVFGGRDCGEVSVRGTQGTCSRDGERGAGGA